MRPELAPILKAFHALIESQAKGWLDYAAWATSLFTFIVTAVTLYYVRKYTQLTGKLLKVSQEQVTISQQQADGSVLPILSIARENRPSTSEQNATLVLTNVGIGPAFNCAVDASLPGIELTASIYRQTMLLRGEVAEIEIMQKVPYKPTKRYFQGELDNLISLSKRGPLNLTATCKSAFGLEYRYSFQMEEGRVMLTGFEQIRQSDILDDIA